MADPFAEVAAGGKVPGVDPFALPAGTPSPFSKGIAAGVAGIKGAVGGVAAGVGNLIGSDTLKQAGLDYAKAQGEVGAANAADVQDVHSVSDAINFGKYALGTAAPSILLTVLGGIAGRGIASIGRAAATESEIAALKAAQSVGTIAGASAASFGQEFGGIYPDAVDTGVENPGTRAVVGGAAAAALDALPEAYLASRLGLLNAAAKPAMKGLGARALGAAKEALKVAPLEGTTESAQSYIERTAAGQPTTDAAAIRDYINSGAVGAIAGGAGGGLAGGFNAVEPTTPGLGTQPLTPGAEQATATVPAPEVPAPPSDEQARAAVDQIISANAVPTTEPTTRPLPSEVTPPSTLPTLTPEAQRASDDAFRAEVDQQIADAQTTRSAAAAAAAAPLPDALSAIRTQDTGALRTELTKQDSRPLPEAAPVTEADRANTDKALAATEPPSVPEMMDMMRLHRGEPVENTDFMALKDRGLVTDTNGETTLTPDGYRAMHRMRRAAIAGIDPLTVTDERRAGVVQQLATEGVRENIAALGEGAPANQRTKLAKIAPRLIEAAAQAAKLPTLQAAASEMRAQTTAIMRGVVSNKQGDVDTFADAVAKKIYEAPTFFNRGAADMAYHRDQVAKYAEQLGYEVLDSHGSSLSRSQYLDLAHNVVRDADGAITDYDKVRLRFSDHDLPPSYKQVHGDADFEVSPKVRMDQGGGNWRDAIKWLAAKAARPVPAIVAGIDARKQAADARLAARNAQYAVAEADSALRQYDAAVAAGQVVATKSKSSRNWNLQGPFALGFLGLGKKDGEAFSVPAALEYGHNYFEQQLRVAREELNALHSSEAVESFRQDTLSDVGQQINTKLAQMLGHDPNLTVRTVTAEPGSPVGSYIRTSKLKSVIEVALNAQNPVSVAYHEGFHYLEDRVLTAPERAMVGNALRKGSTLFKQVLARAKAYDLANHTNLADEVANNPAEARAYAYQYWTEGLLRPSDALGNVFAKLRQFLSKVANLVRGYGFRDVHSIFEAIDRGAYRNAERHAPAIGGPDELFSQEAPLPQHLQDEARAISAEAYQRGDQTASQMYDVTQKVVDYSNQQPLVAASLFGPAAQALTNTFQRTRMRWIQTQNYVANKSVAFANALNPLKVLEQRRNLIASRASTLGLSEWHKNASGVDMHKVGQVLNERTLKQYEDKDPKLLMMLQTLTDKQRAMFAQATEVMRDLLQRTFVADQPTFAEAFGGEPLQAWIQQNPGASDQAIYDESRRLGEADTQARAEQRLTEGLPPGTEADALRNDARYDQFAKWYIDRRDQVKTLRDTGYIPQRRYGDHVVRIYLPVKDAQGKVTQVTAYREHFQSEGAAIKYAADWADAVKQYAPNLKVERSILHKNDRGDDISLMDFLDTARRNGIQLSQPEKERVAKALLAADSARSNRFFKREGTPGASEDIQRVLHEFIVQSASHIARSELNPSITAAQNGRPVQVDMNDDGTITATQDAARDLWAEGGEDANFYRNHFNNVADYVLGGDRSPRWSSMMRGAAMNYFLGGSFASAVINMLSVPMNVPAWLAQGTTTIPNAMAHTLSAWKDVIFHSGPFSNQLRDLTLLKDRTKPMPRIDAVPGLRDALVRAAEDGTTADSEIHQVMGMASGSMLSKSPRIQKALKQWLAPFQYAEATNRLTTFVAAWKAGQENKLAGRDLYKFAQDAVQNTQNVYAAWNRPGIAQQPIGAMLFMFKSYPVFVLEMMEHLFKQNPKAAVFMLTALVAFSGIEGLPFADGIEDLIDTISQRLFNSPFNMRRAMRNITHDALPVVAGVDLGQVLLHGVLNEVTGMDVGSRVGLGNFIPGTRAGTADADSGNIAKDLLGPVFSAALDTGKAAGTLASGIFGGKDLGSAALEAVRNGGPTALRNVIKGAEQFNNDYAQDARGRKLVETTNAQALWQTLGFTSNKLANAYEQAQISKQTEAFYQQVQDDLAGSLTKAVKAGDQQRVTEIYDLMAGWNKANPEMPMIIAPGVIRRRLLEAGMTLGERTQRALPRVLRGTAVDYN